MSDESGDKKIKQLPKELANFTRDFKISKDDSGQDTQIESSQTESIRSTLLCSSSVSEGDCLFNIFEKTVRENSLYSQTEELHVLESEKVILNAFLNEVRNAKPTPLKNWSALQHYIYFIYRRVISPNPTNTNDSISNFVAKKIRELIDHLYQEDSTQLYIRLVTLIREYAIVTRGNFKDFELSKVTTYLVNLMTYYSAFCSAASKLAPLLPEFDLLIMERFNVNWLCLNKSIFYHYVFMSPGVQSKIPLFLKLKEEDNAAHKNILESYECFSDDMSLLAARWAILKKRISNFSQKRAISNPEKFLINDWKIFEEHKKILKTNYWLIRNTQAMQIQDVSELDAHILSLVGDTAYIADFLIDFQGRCLCEDCLAAEFKNAPMSGTSFRMQTSPSRLISCYICHDPVPLDMLLNHMMTKHETSKKSIKLYSQSHQKKVISSKRLSKIGDHTKTRDILQIEGLFDKKSDIKESIFKILNGHSTNNNLPTCDKNAEEIQLKIEDESISTSKNEELLCSKEHNNQDCEDDKLKEKGKRRSTLSFKTFSDTEIPRIMEFQEFCKELQQMRKFIKEISESGDAYKNVLCERWKRITNREIAFQKRNLEWLSNKNENGYSETSSSSTENESFRKPQHKGANNTDSKVFEFLKNSNTQKSAASRMNDTCLGHACGHKCKQEDFEADSKKQAFQDNSDSYKDWRKCECTYCEVFGSSLPMHIHKIHETRDRLRTRLNQRKEKVNENGKRECCQKGPYNSCKIFSNGKMRNISPSSINGNIVNDFGSFINLRIPEIPYYLTPTATIKINSVVKESEIPNETVPVSTAQKIPTKSVIPSVIPSPTEQNGKDNHPRSLSSYSNSSIDSDNVDSRDINELLNYIEGNKKIDKAALAQKKAAKKARQRVKKAQEKEHFEKQLQFQEETRLMFKKSREEAQLQSEVLKQQLMDKKKLNKKNEEANKNQKQDAKKNINKKKDKLNLKTTSVKEIEKESNLIEETIPAMVTIKRITEGDNLPPTVTITLKGSTPESDQLLYTLVNGNNNEDHVAATATVHEETRISRKPDLIMKSISPHLNGKTNSNLKSAKKKKKEKSDNITKEVKVTIAVDKNNIDKKEIAIKKNIKFDELSKSKEIMNNKNGDNKVSAFGNQINSNNDIHLPNLRLPPGITITKIVGPTVNKNYKTFHNNNQKSSTVPCNKSGVIVVDTEKLIQQSITANNNKKLKKKNKKKGQKKIDEIEVSKVSKNSSGSSMITLKNPIFNTLTTTHCNNIVENTSLPSFQSNNQASIFKNDNGMVTIRSPRLQNSIDNGTSISNFLTDLQPMYGPECSSNYVPVCHTSLSESTSKSNFNAQEILSGLPGIEITKVDKNNPQNEIESKVLSQSEVSIIPTNGADKFYFDKDESFESVFTPRDDLEEDMDAEERELEAFKRFCQQSIPPERKEKVAHLNVKDIILKRKDITYS